MSSPLRQGVRMVLADFITTGSPVVALRGDAREMVLTTADGKIHRIPPPQGLVALVEVEAGPCGPQTLVSTACHGKWQDATFGYGSTEPALSLHWEAEVCRGRPGIRYPNAYRDLGESDIRARALSLGEEHLTPLGESWKRLAHPGHVHSPDKWLLFLRSLLPGKIWVGNPQTPGGLQAYSDVIARAQASGAEYWVCESPWCTVYVP